MIRDNVNLLPHFDLEKFQYHSEEAAYWNNSLKRELKSAEFSRAKRDYHLSQLPEYICELK